MERKEIEETMKQLPQGFKTTLYKNKKKLLMLLLACATYVAHDRCVRNNNNFDNVSISYLVDGVAICLKGKEITCYKQQYKMTCAIACMKMVASYFDKDIGDDSTIAQELGKKVEHFSGLFPHTGANYLQKTMGNEYEISYTVRSGLSKIQHTLAQGGLVISCIMGQGDGPHYVVVVDIDEQAKTVRVINPASPMYDTQGNFHLVKNGNKMLSHNKRPDSLQEQVFPLDVFRNKLFFKEKTPVFFSQDTRDVYGIRYLGGICIHCIPRAE